MLTALVLALPAAAGQDEAGDEPGPAELDAAIEKYPDDPALKFRKAQLLRYDAKFGPALRILDELRRQYPDDVDIAYERALALSASGRTPEAIAAVDDAIELAPDYEDLWVLRFRLLDRDDSGVGDATVDRWRTEAERRFPDKTWHQPEPPAEIRPAWTLSAGAGYDALDNGFGDWNQQYVGLARDVPGRNRHAVQLTRGERAALTDITLGLSADYTLAGDWLVGGYVGLSPDPGFQSEFDIGGHAGRVLPGGWIVDVGLRFRSFPDSDVRSTVASVEKYLGAFRFAYRLSISALSDSPTFTGHGLTVNWYYAESASIGLAVGGGRELESLGAGQLLESDVASLAISGRHRLTDRLTLDWYVGTHDQGDIYRRQFVGLAVSIGL
jgi:YaiO family outer membrane protein